MTEPTDHAFVRTDIGLALLGGVVIAAGAGIAVATEVGWYVVFTGALFVAVVICHLGARLAFPSGWRSGATVSVLMVAVPVAIIGPIALLGVGLALNGGF